MSGQTYFGNMKIAMKLNNVCVVCGEESWFHIDDDNSVIFKNDKTPLCKKCAKKLTRKILEGIDF